MLTRIGKGHRPVRRRPLRWTEDGQAARPWGWCGRCGSELFRLGQEVCPDCEKEGAYE